MPKPVHVAGFDLLLTNGLHAQKEPINSRRFKFICCMTESVVLSTPMLISAIIFGLTFLGIFTEEWHGFHRLKFVMLGAALMVAAGWFFDFYTTQQALEMVDLRVILLLATLMIFIGIMAPTGGFQAIAYWLADLSRGRQFVLVAMFAILLSVLSMFLANLTAVILFAPLVVLICQTLRIHPLPFLITIAITADTGGVATSVGDPTSVMISSAAKINFMDYLAHMGPVILAVSATLIFSMWSIFYRDLSRRGERPHFEQRENVRDPRTWYGSLAILAIMVALFTLNVEPWFVGLLGLGLLFFIGYRVDINKVLEEVELPLILFLIGLFILVGGVEHSGFLGWVAAQIKPLVAGGGPGAAIGFMWITAIASAIIDNIPFTAAMIPIIQNLGEGGVQTAPLWWALAIGAGLGGNGTHIGSAVNVFVTSLSERLAKQTGDHSLAITFSVWARTALPAAVMTLVVASFILWAFWGYYSMPFTA